MGIWGAVLSILTQFLSNKSQHVGELVSEETGWRRVRSAAGQCFGPVIVPPVHLGALFPFWRISWSLIPMTPVCHLLCHPQALDHDLGNVSEWCDHWGCNWMPVDHDYVCIVLPMQPARPLPHALLQHVNMAHAVSQPSPTCITVARCLQVTHNASPVPLMNYWQLCRRNLMTLLYWEWHLIPRWLLRSIFARFPKQLFKDLVSWSSDEYWMIDC